MAAVQFLTRLPVPSSSETSAAAYAATLRRSVVLFPLVGGLVGLATAGVFVVASLIGLPPLVAAIVALGCEALWTGAFHEDAFADTCDALGGGWTRAQVLKIMKDSRLGTYGTVALVVGVGGRAAAMASLVTDGIVWPLLAITAAAAWGRIAIVAMMVFTAPIENRDSHAKDISGMQTGATLLIAALLSLPLWIGWLLFAPLLAIVSLAAATLVLVWFRHKILKRVGGTTGDLLGCSAFLVQLVILIGASAR
ncbi:Cobalamin synthase [Roseimaritima ulvae]|uniref:Adenosylcobinamide-GDP ribazoletransferase n=1 Tax=Roseimaritima ulvae TaxID=980254 RepID=A0A5B9QHA1_9BACT|nr:Cobalamin synthase [Roseimaritima ulvae]